MIFRVILLLLLCSGSFAQSFNAAPYQGIGNSGIALKSLYSITNNPAGLVGLRGIEAALAFQSNFVSSELSTQALYIGMPIKKEGAVGISIHRYGLAGVSSLMTLSSVYARSFDDFFSTSLSFNYHSYSITNYGNDNFFSLDLGFQVLIIDQLTLGLIINNISQQLFAEDIDYYLPREIAIGIKYDIAPAIFISSDVYYDPLQKVNIRTGISYEIDNVIFFRTGVASGPLQYYAGIGLKLNNFRIDCATSFHPQLGSSPQIAISYAF